MNKDTDIKIHSTECVYGLGDQGATGLQDFASQHECNAICKEFGLPPATDTLAIATNTMSELSPQSPSGSNEDKLVTPSD